MPASITGGLTQQITENFSLSADVQFTQWHTFDQVLVDSDNPDFVFHEEYRDTWMFSIGGVYRVNEAWTLRAGVGFDESPVVDAFRDTGVPDKDRYMIGVGFGYNITPSVSLDVGYCPLLRRRPRHHERKRQSDRRRSTGRSILNGRYDNAMNYLSISLRTAL